MTTGGPITPELVGATEQALLRSEHGFASIFRLSPEAMCISTTAEGRYADANE